MLKRFRKWLPLASLLVVALWVAGGCTSDEMTENATFVLGELDKASTPAGPIELEGRTLVSAADLPDLVSRVNSVDQKSKRIVVVKKYLALQERIDCILDDVEEAVLNDMAVRCEGKVLVEKEGQQELPGVSEIQEAINTREGEVARKEYLAGYLSLWDEIQKVNHVEESLWQMKRTNAIPVFGPLVRAIHRFPIMYEGEELVPQRDVSKLLDQFRALATDEARRALVTEYLKR